MTHNELHAACILADARCERAFETLYATNGAADALAAYFAADATRTMVRAASARHFAAFVTLRAGEHLAATVTVRGWASRVLRRTSRTANTNGGAA
jgi:hypothetical protein